MAEDTTTKDEEKTEEEAEEEAPAKEQEREGAGLRFKTSKGVCRICRRVGEKLFLKGERCTSAKCSFTRRSYPPGEHGSKRPPRQSEYGKQLREKQKLSAIYNIRERQLRHYFTKASRQKGKTGEILMQTLERRLDNVVYRATFADSRKQARQFVSKRNIKIKGKIVDIPSYLVKPKEVIEVQKAKTTNKKESEKKDNIPSWLEIDKKANKIKVKDIPKKEDLDLTIDEKLIVEFYSK